MLTVIVHFFLCLEATSFPVIRLNIVSACRFNESEHATWSTATAATVPRHRPSTVRLDSKSFKKAQAATGNSLEDHAPTLPSMLTELRLDSLLLEAG